MYLSHLKRKAGIFLLIILTANTFVLAHSKQQNNEEAVRKAFNGFLQEFKNLNAPKLMEYISSHDNSSLLLQKQLMYGKNVRAYFTGAVNYAQSFDSLDVRNIKVDMMSATTAAVTCAYTEWYTPKNAQQMIADGVATYVFVLESDQKWRIRHCAGEVTIRSGS